MSSLLRLSSVVAPRLLVLTIAIVNSTPQSHQPASAAVVGNAARLAAPSETPRPAGTDYQIGPGDVLQINVWKEPDASVPSVVVRPDGKIAVPLLKEIDVAGRTPAQVEEIITSRLSKLIEDADVTVVVAAINSKKLYLLGAVKKEGALSYSYPMSVMQALSEAGGLTEYAKRRKIYILRSDHGKNYRLPFNYDEVIRGQKQEQNISLLPGDTIVVPH